MRLVNVLSVAKIHGFKYRPGMKCTRPTIQAEITFELKVANLQIFLFKETVRPLNSVFSQTGIVRVLTNYRRVNNYSFFDDYTEKTFNLKDFYNNEKMNRNFRQQNISTNAVESVYAFLLQGTILELRFCLVAPIT